MISTAPAVKFGIDAFSGPPLEVWPTSTSEELLAAIKAVYRQVLGNAHVMDSERLVTAESQFLDGSYSVQEFVRAVAQSDFYRARFFESSAPYRFVELNFKHLLGRAPESQEEISEHIRICVEQGYEAEIDSYIDSQEYQDSFGQNVVPYYRGASSQVGKKQVGYNRIFSLFRGPAEIDSGTKGSNLVEAVASNSSSKITPPLSGGRLGGYADATEKTFKIVAKRGTSGRMRRSKIEYVVSGGKMTPTIQQIQRKGATIVSITEVA